MPDPHIYPDPQTVPLNLAAGAASTLIAIEELLGLDNIAEGVGIPPTSFPTTMFIRLAISGAIPAPVNRPTVILKANTGAETEVTTTYPSFTSILDGTNPTDAASACKFDPDGNNVYLVRVLVSITGRTWQIRIKNNDTNPRKFTWVVSSTLVNSRQPWIDVITVPPTSPVALTYNALINQSLAQTLIINNYGTGALSVTGVTPALSGAFALGALPINVDPNGSQSLGITFTTPGTPPAPDGRTTATSTIVMNPNDTTALTSVGHNKQFTVNTATQALEVAILLDDSGSMSLKADGTSTADPLLSRWSELSSAVRQFLELLGHFGESKGKFGVARFPGSNPADLTTYDVIPSPTPIPNLAGMLTAKNAVSAITPLNMTPMGSGLSRVLAATPGYFAADALSINANRRWLILMSDGAWNEGADPHTFIPQLATNKIKVFSAGYGTAGQVDYPTLQDLANGSFGGGQTLQVDATSTSATDLANTFKQAIKSGLTSATSPGDPGGVLRSGAAEARYVIIITPYDTRVAFTLNWNTPRSGRMRLELLTPTCEVISPGIFDTEFGSPVGLGFTSDVRYWMYTLDQDYLQNRENPSQTRYGTWRLLISSDELRRSENAEDSESYTYDVIVESRLQLDVRLDRQSYFAGDPIGISAIVTLDGKPIKNILVSLSLTAPGAAIDNWLATVNVTDEEYRRAAEALAGQDVSAIYIKAYAARLKGIFFEGLDNTDTIILTDPDNQGLYQTTITQTPVPEGYTLYITAVGQTEEGVAFRREKQVKVRLGVLPDSKFTLLDVQYLAITPGSRVLTATVRVTPRDRFVNFLLLDPNRNSTLALTAQGGTLTPLTTTYNGTYSSTLTHSPGTTPVLSLQFGGRTIITNQPVPAVRQFRYVDEVIEFKLGGEAVAGANQHRDPQQVLGDITTKPAEQFVSLGAYGSLTVGIKGQIITAQSDNDITVFVQPDSDLRLYRVDVLTVGVEPKWKELGKSAGITQSFGLGQIGIKAAKAIRSVDESGRTRGANLQPLSTPGVSIRGVGVKQTALSSDTGGCLGFLLGIPFFQWLLRLLGLIS